MAFALESSSYLDSQDDIDLLICWLDDASDSISIPRLAISRLLASHNKEAGPSAQKATGLESILPEGAAQDLLERGRSHESYEETVKLLDEQIKKLHNG